MEADQSNWAIYAVQAIALGGALCAFLFGVLAPKSPGIRWWQRAISGIACFFVCAGVLIAYQCGRVEGASFKAWLPRVLVGLGVFSLAIASDLSGWQSSSEWARDSMVAAVYLLSLDAASSEGSVIHTINGDPAEITGRWNSAFTMGAYGVALGALFLRNTITASLTMGWLGAMVGAFLSAHFFAWCLDSIDSGILDSQYGFSYFLHFFGPILLAPWAALAVLIVTHKATSNPGGSDAP